MIKHIKNDFRVHPLTLSSYHLYSEIYICDWLFDEGNHKVKENVIKTIINLYDVLQVRVVSFRKSIPNKTTKDEHGNTMRAFDFHFILFYEEDKNL